MSSGTVGGSAVVLSGTALPWFAAALAAGALLTVASAVAAGCGAYGLLAWALQRAGGVRDGR